MFSFAASPLALFAICVRVALLAQVLLAWDLPTRRKAAMSPDVESVSSSSSSSSETSDAPPPPPPPSSVGSVGMAALRVCYTSRKCRQCTLCNAKSTEESPLEYAEEIFPEVQGRIPWRSYEKVKADDGEQVRVPSGKLCLICFNVYRALGFSAAFISLSPLALFPVGFHGSI